MELHTKRWSPEICPISIMILESQVVLEYNNNKDNNNNHNYNFYILGG